MIPSAWGCLRGVEAGEQPDVPPARALHPAARAREQVRVVLDSGHHAARSHGPYQPADVATGPARDAVRTVAGTQLQQLDGPLQVANVRDADQPVGDTSAHAPVSTGRVLGLHMASTSVTLPGVTQPSKPGQRVTPPGEPDRVYNTCMYPAKQRPSAMKHN